MPPARRVALFFFSAGAIPIGVILRFENKVTQIRLSTVFPSVIAQQLSDTALPRLQFHQTLVQIPQHFAGLTEPGVAVVMVPPSRLPGLAPPAAKQPGAFRTRATQNTNYLMPNVGSNAASWTSVRICSLDAAPSTRNPLINNVGVDWTLFSSAILTSR